MKRQLFRLFSALLGLTLCIVATWVLHHQLKGYQYHDVMRHVGSLPAPRLLLALLLTILDYLVMTGYDTLALRYVRHPLAYRKIALASFIGSAFSNSIGLSLLTSVPVRYRLYSAWGLPARAIASIVALNGMTFWLGLFAVGAVAFLLEPLTIPPALHLPFASTRPLGVICLILVGGYMVSSTWRRPPLTILEWEMAAPSPSLALAQIALSSLDWTLAGSVLYILLPAAADLSYRLFLGIFLLGHIAGALSLLPGGIGVFETVALWLLSPLCSAPLVLASLLFYRGIYYLLPLAVAIAMFGAHELLQHQYRRRGSPLPMMAAVQRNGG